MAASVSPPEPTFRNAASGRIVGLKRRADFVRVARGGRRLRGRSVNIQSKPRETDDGSGPRFGLTVTKQMGGACVRNRIKRRLRAALAQCRDDLGAAPLDVVVLAQPGALTESFESLVAELRAAFRRIGGSTT